MTQIYRKTSIGLALTETLAELIKKGHLSEEVASVALKRFDESIYKMFEEHELPMNCFKSKRLANYRLCDDVWTLILDDTLFHDGNEIVKVDRVKIVAVRSEIGNKMRTTSEPLKCKKLITADDDSDKK